MLNLVSFFFFFWVLAQGCANICSSVIIGCCSCSARGFLPHIWERVVSPSPLLSPTFLCPCFVSPLVSVVSVVSPSPSLTVSLSLSLFSVQVNSQERYGLKQVHNMTLDLTLRCIARALTLVATQRDTRINSNSILVFPALRSLCLVTKIWLRTDYFHAS